MTRKQASRKPTRASPHAHVARPPETPPTTVRQMLDAFYGSSADEASMREAPESAIAAPEEVAEPDDRLEKFLDRVAPEVVPATYVFEFPLDMDSGSDRDTLTLRIRGRRQEVAGRRTSADGFVHDQSVPGLVPGCGPVAVTAKIPDTHPGEWVLKAQLLRRADDTEKADRPARLIPTSTALTQASWSWRRWRVSNGVDGPVNTCRSPFVRSPAVQLGSWTALVVLGILVALFTQAWVISAAPLNIRHALEVSLMAVMAGIGGGKGWFIFLHRRERRREGWSVQGFVAGFAVTSAVLLVLLHQPVGAFLDASAAPLVFGLAIGRLGCFFTGCCAGRTTASRWGVWSSNRTIGARRIPTQLMESATGFAVGWVGLAAILVSGPHHGALFLAAVAGYTLVRQGILELREEQRQSKNGVPVVAALSVAGIVAGLALIFWA